MSKPYNSEKVSSLLKKNKAYSKYCKTKAVKESTGPFVNLPPSFCQDLQCNENEKPTL